MKPTHMIIHHSATKDSGTVSWTAIRKWHIGEHPQSPYRWNDIGYHFGVEIVDGYYEVIAGRPIDRAGAHTVGMNNSSIGVCFVGNFDEVPPPDAMILRAIRVLAPIVKLLEIPLTNIQPHSHYAVKSCPGKLFPMMGFVNGLKTQIGG
jgi:N-acetylmuramoyl-L-alanine amidase